MRRRAGLATLAGLIALAALPVRAEHAIAMHGTPKYGPGFARFDYVNPQAPKGGSLRLHALGTFDSLNPFVVVGTPALGLGRVFDSLLARSADEPFTLYAHLAEDVSVPDDRSSVTFRLRPGARFHDGSPVTVDDIAFSWETLRRHGRPNHRTYYRQVVRVERPAPDSITFHFGPEGNRELPLILGLMPILPQAAFADEPFDRARTRRIPGTGFYRVDEVDMGRRISYRRVEDHWAAELATARGLYNVDRISYLYFRDESSALAAFTNRTYDLRFEPDPRVWAKGYAVPSQMAGRIQMAELPHGRPAGMYGLVMNTRRKPFQDWRVRRAMAFALDFQWLNRTLYHGAYSRTTSYFSNSGLAAEGPPSPAELALLEPFRQRLPAELFAGPYTVPDTENSSLRDNLQRAAGLLREAGWRIRGDRLVHEASGEPFAFEIMLVRPENEKLALHLAGNLKRLGIEAAVRTVDTAQFQRRQETFDFDAMLYNWGQSLSPGNEQAFYWSSAAATQEGSRNYAGIEDPVVNSLIGQLSDAPTRDALVSTARALDRALLWGHYVVPLFHLKSDRVAYWDRFGRPATLPLYGMQLDSWWVDPNKAERMSR